MWHAVEAYCWLVAIVSAALVALLAMWVTFNEPTSNRAKFTWMGVFSCFSLVGILAAIADHNANEREQSSRFLELNRKLKESETLREGFLSLDSIVIRSETSVLAPGHQFGGNFYATNKGATRVFNAIGTTEAYVVDVDENTERMVRQAFENAMQPLKAEYASKKTQGQSEIAPGLSIFGTTLTRKLTAHDVEGLSTGKVRIYFLSWGTWRNSRGDQDSSYDCRYLQSWTLPSPYEQKDIVWHYCGQ